MVVFVVVVGVGVFVVCSERSQKSDHSILDGLIESGIALTLSTTCACVRVSCRAVLVAATIRGRTYRDA